MGEEVVKREVLRGQTKEWTAVCLTNYARNVITKAKYKRNNSTRKIAQKVQHHNINVWSTTVWSLTNKGWKTFKRKKIPLLGEKQRSPRLKISRKYFKLTAEDWENFLFTDECRKYQVHYPNPENQLHHFLVHRNQASFLPIGEGFSEVCAE